MKTKNALAGLLGLFGSLAAFPDFRAAAAPPPLAGFLFTESLINHSTKRHEYNHKTTKKNLKTDFSRSKIYETAKHALHVNKTEI